MNQQLRSECERVGKDVDQMLKERGNLTKSLEDARARLAELRRVQAAAQDRLALFKKFEDRFQSLIAAKQLSIGSRNGHLVMTVPGNLLFDHARVDIKATGKGALLEIAKALSGVPGRKFQVGVHTDSAATGSPRYPTNWELSALRAVDVVKLFIQSGVRSDMLMAAGFGDSDPVDANDGAKNRRVEIQLRLDASELVSADAPH